MKRLLAATLALALASCATPMIWDKAGGTQEAYNADVYACERDARQSGYYGGGISGALEMRGFFQRCMIAKGYTLRQ